MDELRRHYSRSMRMGINASPTLLVNNTVFPEELSYFHLSKFACGAANAGGQSVKRPAKCDSLPECASDADCKKPGKIGACVSKNGKKAVCGFKDAPRFTLTAVTHDSALFHPEYAVFSNMQNDFPGMVIDTIKSGTDRGKALLQEFDPQYLPLFLFDTTIKNAANFPSISSGFLARKSKLVFKDGMFKPSYFYKRKLMAGTIALYVDPLFPGSLDAVRIAAQEKTGKNPIKIMPNIFERPDSAGLPAEATLRNEEALRWLVIQKYHPAKFNSYLRLFIERKNMSYWFTDCKKLGINVDDFVEKVRKNGPVLADYWKEIAPFGMKEPVEFLIANREVVAVKNPKELSEILQKLR
jgi:hypothetical protein